MRDYDKIQASVKGIIEDIPYNTANMANISAILYNSLPNVNWAGFYIVEDGVLVLGPFQGNVACIKIPKGRGVCGTAWENDSTQVVKNVHEFPGHIACDCASNSEIVVPIHRNGEFYGVLDIDSTALNNFSEIDQIGLEKVVKLLEAELK